MCHRTGLGNALYSGSHKVGSHGPADLQQFVTKHFTTNRSALVGVGIDHAVLTKVDCLYSLAGVCEVASPPGGGERIELSCWERKSSGEGEVKRDEKGRRGEEGVGKKEKGMEG